MILNEKSKRFWKKIFILYGKTFPHPRHMADSLEWEYYNESMIDSYLRVSHTIEEEYAIFNEEIIKQLTDDE